MEKIGWLVLGGLTLGFHLGQLPFGGVLWGRAAVMLTALVLLLRAERADGARPRVQAAWLRVHA
jgi:hypothetical protein